MQYPRRALGRILREAAKRMPILDPWARRVSLRPWEESLMEVSHGTWLGMFPFKDEEGRLLGEANTVPLWLREPIESDEWMPCRYEGSRQGLAFNVAALRQVTAAWKEVLSDVTRLRAIYAAHAQVTGNLRPVHLFCLAHTSTSIPAFLARGPARVASGRLPVRYAALFKVMAGVHMAVAHMMATKTAVDVDWTADALFDYIESRGLFVSVEGNACGGPRKMVIELLQVAIEGASPGEPIPDEAAILKYGLANARIEVVMDRRDAALRPFRGESVRSDEAYAQAFEAMSLGGWVQAASEERAEYARLEQGVVDQLTLAARDVSEALERPFVPISRRLLLARYGKLARMLRKRNWNLQVRDEQVQVRGPA